MQCQCRCIRIEALIIVLLVFAVTRANAQASPTRSMAVAQLQSMQIDPTIERLLQFSADGDLVTVDRLLSTGVSALEAEPVRRVTPLHNAAAQGHLKIVARILEMGADPNATD